MSSKRTLFSAVVCCVIVSGAISSLMAGATTRRDKALPLRLVFADEFETSTLDSRWTTCYWWAEGNDGCTISSNNELQTYRRANVSVRGGALRLVARRESVGAFAYTSGMVSTGPAGSERHHKPGFAFTYGRIEARVRVPRGVGLWPAFWLLPTRRESRPEIDILEVDGADTSTISTHIHTSIRDAGVHTSVADLSDGYHVISLRWMPGSLTWSVDGKKVWSITGDDVSSEPMYVILNLAVGGESVGPPAPQTRFPATYNVDWVRVWQ